MFQPKHNNLRNSITALDPSSFQSATMKKMLGIVEDIEDNYKFISDILGK